MSVMLLQWKQNSFRLQLHKKSLARLSGLLLLVKNNWNNVIWDMESISGILQNYTDEEITWKLMSTKALMSVILWPRIYINQQTDKRWSIPFPRTSLFCFSFLLCWNLEHLLFFEEREIRHSICVNMNSFMLVVLNHDRLSM